MADLTAGEIDELRTVYLRDKYVASPLTALSHYNRAVKASFLSDAQIELIHDRLQTDYAEELESVYDSKYRERLAEGDSDANAISAATAQKKQVLFRLIRAECRQMMMEDPGFVGSIADEKNRAALFAAWKDANGRDRTFARSRGAASFSSIDLVRL